MKENQPKKTRKPRSMGYVADYSQEVTSVGNAPDPSQLLSEFHALQDATLSVARQVSKKGRPRLIQEREL